MKLFSYLVTVVCCLILVTNFICWCLFLYGLVIKYILFYYNFILIFTVLSVSSVFESSADGIFYEMQLYKHIVFNY